MHKSQIDTLLKKYWDAETTLEEESVLHTYFNSQDISDSHKEFAELFQYYTHAGGELSSKDLLLSPEIIKQYERNNSLIMRIRPLLKYAAAIAFLLYGYSLCIDKYSVLKTESIYAGKYTELSEEEDAEEALKITIEALSFLTAKINKTEETISNNFAPIQKAINVIN